MPCEATSRSLKQLRMSTNLIDHAVAEVFRVGKAIIKFISANDAGATGSHQAGIYLPKEVWPLYTPNPPIRGINADTFPKVRWPDGRITESRVVWYGTGSRSEYRLTRFGRGFPFRTPDSVGSLLVLVPFSHESFSAYVFDHDDEIEEVQSRLGVEIVTWGVYDRDQPELFETDDRCVSSRAEEFIKSLPGEFPSTAVISGITQQILSTCMPAFSTLSADYCILQLRDEEYKLFRRIEKAVSEPQLLRLVHDIDGFLALAQSILQRRKSRAGWSLEHHVAYILKRAGVPFDARAHIDGKISPDLIIPGKAAYENPDWPVEKLFIVGVKTTAKDRWRQVTREGHRVPRKHLITLQAGVSVAQMDEMTAANVQLIVPKDLHNEYPASVREKLLTVEDFISLVRRTLKDAPMWKD